MTAPTKTCDYCGATGEMPTFMNGETICYTCLHVLPKTLPEARQELMRLRALLAVVAQPATSVPDFSNTKDAARYRWLRENGLANEKRESRAVLPRGGKKASMAFRYWTTPEELDMTIDAMLAAPKAKP